MDEQTQQPQGPATTSQPELTVTDLFNLKSVVEFAVKRGAFNANELSGVGAVYDKLNNFLSSVSANQQPAAEQPQSPTQE